MSTALTLAVLLRDGGQESQAFSKRVVHQLDQAGLRYHFYSQGMALLRARDGGAHELEESGMPLGSERREQRLVELLTQADDDVDIGLDLDCGDWKTRAILRLGRIKGRDGIWLLEIDFDEQIEVPEEEGVRSCLEAFLLSCIAPMLDSGTILFGLGSVDYGLLDADQVAQALAGRIPDIYSLNIYPPHLLERYQSRIKYALSKWGKVLVETPGGAVIWEVSGATEEFYRMPATDRLRMFGIFSADK